MSTELKRSLRLFDGLTMVVGVVVGAGIFRTPGIIAARLGRPWLTFVAWVAGGALAFLGALIFAELATRLPKAGGKYVYAREAFGPRAAFVIGAVEGLVLYPAAIAAISVAAGEFLGRLLGWSRVGLLGPAFVVLFTAINLTGVAAGRWVQNVVTSAKILALGGIVVIAFAAGHGAGWHGTLPDAPTGRMVWGAFAVAFQAVIWTYYGYVEAAKIAEEVVEPERTLPRVFLLGIAVVTGLYLLLNAAFLHVLPFEQIAASNLVAGDAAAAIFGTKGDTVITVLALLVVLASLNGNVFVTPRVLFGMARDGLAPAALARVNAGGTPGPAMVVVGIVAALLAATGQFGTLLSLAILIVLVIDGFSVAALYRLRKRQPEAPFRAPLYPYLLTLFIGVYVVLFAGSAYAQPRLALATVVVLAGMWALSWAAKG
jgi:APA family basic amino acid/polyamine antiporter